jgi:hypothetical protein
MFRRNFQKVEIVETSDKPPEYLTISCEPATISAKPVGVGATFQRLILTGERSGLQTHIAATIGVLLCGQMKS